MSDRLLEYVFKINEYMPIPPANTGYLKKALVLVKPLDESIVQEIVTCTTSEQIAALTANDEAKEMLKNMTSIMVLPTNDLNLEAIINDNINKFFTILIASDFTPSEVNARQFGKYKGVVGYSTEDVGQATTDAGKSNFCAFIGSTTYKAKNMFYTFGKFLSQSSWKNQQYIEMPYDDGITTQAEDLFNARISFVLTSEEFGPRLAFFAAGKRAIIAPYVYEELYIALQSAALTWINLNMPQYTVTEATLLEEAEQNVIDGFRDRKLITGGNIRIVLEQDNFVAKGYANVPPPTAYWRTDTDLIQQ